MSADLVAQAMALTKRKRLEGQVSFLVTDALQLPFSDQEFDVAVSQAILVLVEDKRRAIQEALRVVKPGGYLGWVELSWKKPPTTEFLDAVSNVLCAYCIQNVHTFQGWENLFREAGINQLTVQPFSLESGGMVSNSGMRNMLSNEGLINTGRIMFKYLTNARIRTRMNTMSQFFKDHADCFGYGIYTGRK
ncbi:MAG: methyltransferase domain-containing protein [candidate division KSB1 bacterium]|nr:methyltransferase domain-containing protein [candidate division KSB1 bacterium]